MEITLNKSPPKTDTKHLHVAKRLFLNKDGTSIVFNVIPSPDRDLIVQLIKDGGGAVTVEDSLPSSGVITISSGSQPMESAKDVISSSFIYACCFNSELMNVEDFRLIPGKGMVDISVKRNVLPHDSDHSESMISLEDMRNILVYLIKSEQLWKDIEENKVCGNKPWEIIQQCFSVWSLKLIYQLASSNVENLCGMSLQDDARLSKNGSPVVNCNPTSRTNSNEEPRDEIADGKIDDARCSVEKVSDGGPKKSSGCSALNKDIFCERNGCVSEKEVDVPSSSKKKRIAGRTSAVIDDSASETEVCKIRSVGGEREEVIPNVRNDGEKEGVHLVTDGKSVTLNVAREEVKQKERDYPHVVHNSKSPTKRMRTLISARKSLHAPCNKWLKMENINLEWKRPTLVTSTPVCRPSSSNSEECDDGKSESRGSECSESESELSTESPKKKIPYHQRLYSHKEDMEILKWLCFKRKRANDSLAGNRIWKFMESRKIIPGRSWQSLRERFRRRIAPNLKNYPIPKQEMNKLLHEIRQ